MTYEALPITDEVKERRKVLVYIPSEKTWFIAVWWKDEYAKRPRPFWKIAGEDIVWSIRHQPTHYAEFPKNP